MKKRKLTISIFLVSLILGISATYHVVADDYGEYYGNNRMTMEEVSLVVRNNSEVASWLVNHTLDSENIWGWDGFWTVQMSTYNQTDFFYLEIIVNDLTQKVLSVSYYFDEYRTWELENLIIANARNYLSQPEFFSLFGDNIQNFDMWMLGNSKIQFNYWEMEYQMYGELAFTHSLNGTLNFQLIVIQSEISFGNATLNFDDALAIAENTYLFEDFKSNYSFYGINTMVVQYLNFDTPYSHFPPGYVIQIEQGAWIEGEILEFVEGTFIERTNYDFGFESSYVWFDNYKRINAFINGSDGTVLQLKKYYLDSYAHFANLALEEPGVSELVNDMRKFNGNFYLMYEDIYRLTINDEFSPARIIVEMNVTSGKILFVDLLVPIPPTRTESDIVNIALSNYEIIVLMQNTIDFDYSISYDFQGTWHLEFFDRIMTEASGSIEIDDISGDVIYSSAWYNDPPNLEISDVIQIALEADLRAFNRDHLNARISMFFDWDRNWQILVYDPIYVDSYIKITVGDTNQDIVLIKDNTNTFSTSNDVDAVKAYIQTLDEYKEFENLVGEKYEYIYYLDNWRVYLENIDSENVKTEIFFSLGDSSFIITDNYSYEYWMNRNNQRIWPAELNDLFEYQWGFERLDKIPYTLLSDVIVEYTPTTPLSDESTQSLELPAFTISLSISILFLTTFISKKSTILKS
ncbi:MAG: hypothetical protein HeimC2_04630 [Candidatus Heimdallarchaeota archaeon LC_2]|nr:MAG: hypothetical protein HeimC2_04630 [Candidatus Heimdallarchaeota archaeon LC_2]